MHDQASNMSESKEVAWIDKLIAGFKSPENRLNKPHESDSELISLPGNKHLLAVSTDTIFEEIQSGLYRDPFQIGWMTVTVNVSDLAAVGASPVGILLSEGIPKTLDPDFIERMQEGIARASEVYGIPILGGDTNQTNELYMGGTALGHIEDACYMKRSGCKPGDSLFTTAKAGIGSCCSFSLINNSYECTYLPKARVQEGMMIRNYSDACIDTSDGLIAGIDQLIRSSKIGIDLQVSPRDILCEDALAISERYNLPDWIFLNGPHGDFELLFSVSDAKTDEFKAYAGSNKLEVIYLGKVLEHQGLFVNGNESCDTGLLRNLFDDAGSDPEEYLKKLLNTQSPWKLNY